MSNSSTIRHQPHESFPNGVVSKMQAHVAMSSPKLVLSFLKLFPYIVIQKGGIQPFFPFVPKNQSTPWSPLAEMIPIQSYLSRVWWRGKMGGKYSVVTVRVWCIVACCCGLLACIVLGGANATAGGTPCPRASSSKEEASYDDDDNSGGNRNEKTTANDCCCRGDHSPLQRLECRAPRKTGEETHPLPHATTNATNNNEDGTWAGAGGHTLITSDEGLQLGGHVVLPLSSMMSPVSGRGVTKNVLLRLRGGKSTRRDDERECKQHCCGMDITKKEVLFSSI